MLSGSGGIRTHASEETGALNQRLRPLGHATFLERAWLGQQRMPPGIFQSDEGTGGKKRGSKKVELLPCQHRSAAVTRIRTWVTSATTKGTNHYTITATATEDDLSQDSGLPIILQPLLHELGPI